MGEPEGSVKLKDIGAQALAWACAPFLVMILGFLVIWLGILTFWKAVLGKQDMDGTGWWNGTTNEGGKRG